MSDTPPKDTEAKMMPPPSAVPFKKPSALPTKKVTPKKPAVAEKKDEPVPIRPEGYGLIEEQDHEEEHQESNTNQNNTNATPEPEEPKPNPPQERPTSIPIDVYQPPFWSAPATDANYSLEVLRDGAIIDNIDLHSDQKPFYVFGRLPICDIMLDHQTISRYHAIIQFRQNGDAYLYDLGSTHGTFVNKIQIKPKAYLKIKNGYHIKFGQSSRSYIVGGGPDEEKQQEDAEELKKRILQVQEAYKNAKPKGKQQSDQPDEGEIQNLEDDTEYFSSSKMKDENKKKISDFKRRLGDDDDDDGVKKNAKKKKTEEEEPDEDEGEYMRMRRENEEMFKEFYGDDDDDQDEFYDRTKKKNKNSGVETYETLLAKEKFFNNQKAIIERDIEKLQRAAGGSGANDEGDSLDSFMASIGTSLEQEKIDKKKESLKEVEDELARIKPLIAVAKPAIDLLQKPKAQQQNSSSEPDSKKRKIDEVKSDKNDDDDETPVKKPKTEPKGPAPAPVPAPKPKLANVFEEKEPAINAKSKRGPVQAPTLDFLQQIKHDSSSPSVKTAVDNMEEDEDNNNNNTSGSNKKKKESKKLEPEISYEEWKPPEGQRGDGRTALNDKYGY